MSSLASKKTNETDEKNFVLVFRFSYYFCWIIVVSHCTTNLNSKSAAGVCQRRNTNLAFKTYLIYHVKAVDQKLDVMETCAPPCF